MPRTKKPQNAENVVQLHAQEPQNAGNAAETTDKTQKAPRYYKQKKPNGEVRKEAALKYIDEKTRPKIKPGNFPGSDAVLRMEPGDNSRYVAFGMMIYNMTDIDICNETQLNDRINEYFALCAQYDMKPGVASFAMALGVDRGRLLEIRSGADRTNLPPGCRACIKKAYKFLESYWESIMQNGKVNPASGIFLGKNNYGYKDEQDIRVAPVQKMMDQTSPEDLQKRIEALPDD